MSKLSFNQGEPQFIPLTTYRELPAAEMEQRAQEFYALMLRRKTIREFSSRAVSRNVIEHCLLAAILKAKYKQG